MATTKQEVEKQDSNKVEAIERTRSGKVFVPAVDIVEAEDHLTLLADMPGSDEKSIDITLENDVLTIQGGVNWTAPDGFTLSHFEYEVGDFNRSFTLGQAIDRDKIAANYNNGVLRLTLPKVEPAKPRKITVKAG